MITENSFGVKELTKENQKIRKRYNCIYHNDDTTTFEFVIDSLVQVFHRSESEAKIIAAFVDEVGTGVANKKPLSKDIAETKKEEVLRLAKKDGHPLRVTVDEI